MGVYERAQATASRMIAKYGAKVTYRTVRNGPLPDATKPYEPGPSVTVDYANTPVVFLKSDRKATRGVQYAPQSEIPAGYELALIAGDVAFEPTLKDVIIRDGKTITIEWLEPLKPADLPILYRVGFLP